MSTLKQRSPGSWTAWLELPRGADGKRKQKTVTIKATSRRAAEKELIRLQADLQRGLLGDPGRLTVGEYLLDKWLNHIRPSVAPKTLDTYAMLMRAYVVPDLGGLRLDRLRPLAIQGLYDRLLLSGRKDGRGGLSPRSVLHIHRVLCKSFGQAVKWGLLGVNPALATEPPSAKSPEMQALDEAETVRLLETARGSRLHGPILLAAVTGLRRGELLALRWQDIDLPAKCLHVRRSLGMVAGELIFSEPKTAKSRRRITLPGIAVEMLRALKHEQGQESVDAGPCWQDEEGLVFTRPDGRPMSPNAFTKAFGEIVQKAGLGIRFHDLRHGHASQLLRQGVNVKAVSERLGHSTIQLTLDTYSHLLGDWQTALADGVETAYRTAIADREQLERALTE